MPGFVSMPLLSSPISVSLSVHLGCSFGLLLVPCFLSYPAVSLYWSSRFRSIFRFAISQWSAKSVNVSSLVIFNVFRIFADSVIPSLSPWYRPMSQGRRVDHNFTSSASLGVRVNLFTNWAADPCKLLVA